MYEFIDRLAEFVVSQRPAVLPSYLFTVNGICVELFSETCPNSNFVLKIFEPWVIEHVWERRAANEEWQVFFWTCEKTLETVFAELDRIQPESRDLVRRWRGDFEQERFTGQAGKVIVRHQMPFTGLTVFCSIAKVIHGVFASQPDISHCEHILKYPARTEARKYGRWDCHASGVVIDGTALLFLGKRQSGKTTCALEMVARGGKYIANDLCAVSLSKKDSLLVHSIPHMIRLTEQNVLRWSNIAERAFGLEKGNSDYTCGIVFCSGKYEVYAPLATDFVGSVTGKTPFPVKTIVFPTGELEKTIPSIQPLSSAETTERLKGQLYNDHPLPDWLSTTEQKLQGARHSTKLSEQILPVQGFDYRFCFSDCSAFDLLLSAL